MDEATINEIVKEYGTATYVFDIAKVKKRIKYLRNKLPERISLCYAIKANTFIVKDIEDDVEKFEVCSPGEYEICKKMNVNPNKILISGVYKTPNVIENMLQNDEEVTHYTIESMEQFKLLKSLNHKRKLKLMLRLTSGNQFGMNENEVEEIIKNYLEYENIEIVGIQYFSGTQKTSLKNLKREVDYIDSFVKKLYEQYGFEAQELEFGPGFPIFYFKNSEFDEETFMQEFSEIMNAVEFQGKLILELGRSIAASCGTYITRVVDKKSNKGQNYAILDGGMNHIVYYGQSMAMKIPKCEVYPKRQNTGEEKWNLCGSLCTINDILVKQFPVDNLQIGDIFVFENTGAYCMTEGISLFLSRELPKVVKIREDKTVELVREHIPTYQFNM